MGKSAAQDDESGGLDQLRRAMVQARGAIDDPGQAAAADQVRTRLLALRRIQDATTVGVYHAVRGELDLSPTIAALRSAGIATAYPLLRRTLEQLRSDTASSPTGAAMTFHLVASDDQLVPGALGIPAPNADLAQPGQLDVVLVPLVAFDDRGNRVGMGGGYYDRTFARPPRPVLIGVAHDCQRVARLEPRAWDVALDLVVTPSAVYASPETPENEILAE